MWSCESPHRHNETLRVLADTCLSSGYILNRASDAKRGNEMGKCHGSLFAEYDCVCYGFASGCLCDQVWTEESSGCSGASSFQAVLFSLSYSGAGIMIVVSVWAVWQLGWVYACRDHTRAPIPLSFKHIPVVLKSELQRFVGCCCSNSDFLGSLPAHVATDTATPQTNVKLCVLWNVATFCLLFGIWLLNLTDTTGGSWWFAFVSTPHLMYAYESILLEWRRVTKLVMDKMRFPGSHSDSCQELCCSSSADIKRLLIYPKVLIFSIATIAAWAEAELRLCGEASDAHVRSTAACAERWIVYGTTRTTWPFLLYSACCSTYAVLQFSLFFFWGKRLHAFTLAMGDHTVQESEKVVRFLHQVTVSFFCIVAIVGIYCFYPHTTMKSTLLLLTASLVSLLLMVRCVIRCVRVPKCQWGRGLHHSDNMEATCNAKRHSLARQAAVNERWLSMVNPTALAMPSAHSTNVHHFKAPSAPPPPPPKPTSQPTSHASFSTKISAKRSPPKTPCPFKDQSEHTPPVSLEEGEIQAPVPVLQLNLIDILPQADTPQMHPQMMPGIRTRSWAEAISHRLTGRGPLWDLEERSSECSSSSSSSSSNSSDSCHEDGTLDTC